MSTIPVHERQYNDYVVNVRIDRSEAPGGTIVVNMFLGDVPPDARQWEHTSKPGVVAFMGGRRTRRRTDEDEDDRRWETGQQSLTAALIDLIEARRAVGAAGDVLRTLARGEVGPFLQRNLHWRVQSGQREVPLGEVPSLRVSVAACTATVPDSEREGEFVQYGPYEVVGAATQGRPGGFDVGVDTV